MSPRPTGLQRTSRLRSVWLWILLTAPFLAHAHEIRPAYLEIREDASGPVHVLWKQPAAGDLALALHPSLSSGWLGPQSATMTRSDTYLILQWTIQPPHASLEDQRLTIEGLDHTVTDTLVRVVRANGSEATWILKPTDPTLIIPRAESASLPTGSYLQLGVMHIWTGLDHLLYVLGLVLLVRSRANLLKTITAFTAAHSLTLAAATLHFVSVPPAPIEALIALSIVYVAVELVHLHRGCEGLAYRCPWLVAFAFGLLHGFGFAGALAQAGLPAQNIPLALLFFNIGIELGQLTFVTGVLIAAHVVLRLTPRSAAVVARLTPHAIGTVAAFWLIDRTSQIL
jgi:hypothetical protein